jgi:hypothetical protein
MGLAEDGAQIEGATFWASTMQYRLFYMDALRRITGRDLYPAFKQYMKADLAYAQIAAPKEPGWSENDQTVILSPSYGQLDYYAPVLLALAKEYRDTDAQRLALWDQTLGNLQQTRYITRKGEQLLFEMGGYAALWHDPTVDADSGGAALSYHFPSVGEVYARSGWEAGDIVAGLRKSGETIIHAGGAVVLATIAAGTAEETKSGTVDRKENGNVATLTRNLNGITTTLSIERPDQATLTWSGLQAPVEFHAHKLPKVEGNTLVWENGLVLEITAGALESLSPEGYVPAIVVGMGKLPLEDPLARAYPLVRVAPHEGAMTLKIMGHR